MLQKKEQVREVRRVGLGGFCWHDLTSVLRIMLASV
jgi:hypothetical protein